MSQLICFDVETTGLPKNRNVHPKNYENWPHIVQFSWIVYCDKKMTEKSFIIKPTSYVIPTESTNIHGITHKEAIEKGIDIKDVLSKFINDCKKSSLLIAHNIEFDKNVILANCYRHNLSTTLFEDKKILCTMKTTTNLCKLPGNYGYKYPRLSELHFHLFNKQTELKLHNSLNDVKITLKCFKELCKRNYYKN